MPPRGPRIASALTILAAGLFAGRWIAGFLADRWWAATVSSEAGVALTRRALMGLGLDALGFTLALLWFGLNARLLLATVGELGPRERGGNPAVRAHLQHPRAWFWAAIATVLLALLSGTGLSEWEGSLALAGSGLRFGLVDPALGRDAGWYVAWLPLWVRVQAFTTVLLLVALSGTGALQILTGAIRLGRGRLAITDRARRHLGLLLALLALLLGSSRVLAPYQLAAGIPEPVVPGVVHLYQSAGLVLAGLAMAAGGVSVLWAVRPAHGLAAGAWFAFTAALVGAEALLPADRPDPRDPLAAEALGRFEGLGYGLRADPPMPEEPRLSLWDRVPVARQVGDDRADAMAVMRGAVPVGSDRRPAWFAVGPGRRGEGLALYAFADDTVAASGRPLALRADGTLTDSLESPLLELSRLSPRPAAPALDRGEGPGVALGGFLRRVTLAWALQAGDLISAEQGAVAWHLTPAGRLRHVAPWAVWSGAQPWTAGGRVRWVVDGYSVSDAFPVSRRRPWQGRTVSYARAGFVGIVDGISGGVEIFLRPGADSLSVAWARVTQGLVRGAESLPDGLAASLGYPEELLLLQADLLARRGAPEAAADPALEALTRGHPLPGPGTTSLSVPLVVHATGSIAGLVIGQRTPDGDRIGYLPSDSTGTLEGPGVLERQWQRLPLVAGIRDSVLASGADTMLAPVRYARQGTALIAWQPLWVAERAGRGVRLVAIGVARGPRFSAGRTLPEAWMSLEGAGAGRAGSIGPLGSLEEARRWVAEADSALRRGDLAAFAKAFASLREALTDTVPRAPK